MTHSPLFSSKSTTSHRPSSYLLFFFSNTFILLISWRLDRSQQQWQQLLLSPLKDSLIHIYCHNNKPSLSSNQLLLLYLDYCLSTPFPTDSTPSFLITSDHHLAWCQYSIMSNLLKNFAKSYVWVWITHPLRYNLTWSFQFLDSIEILLDCNNLLVA